MCGHARIDLGTLFGREWVFLIEPFEHIFGAREFDFSTHVEIMR
jgi:hypothetical protein